MVMTAAMIWQHCSSHKNQTDPFFLFF